MDKRVRATKKQKRYKRKASAKDFERMVVAASAVVMGNRGIQYRSEMPDSVMFRFPYWVKFSPGFPKGKVVERTAETNVHRINAVTLLNWLYANGYSPYDSKMLVTQTRHYEVMSASIERMFDI